MIRVLVVDDHQLVRGGVCSILALADDMEVVGEAESGEEALTKTEALSPDVVLMDLKMPGIGGIEATRTIPSRPSFTTRARWVSFPRVARRRN